ncbi:MAG: hypothetical protein ACOVQ0_00770 [Novosphingobium sp.]|uniref:hypothetical protein n=1 Tax=Novosphingobium sp. TaxID=1874826 RepID=UPI003B994ED3
MTTIAKGDSAAAVRRAHIEAALSRYPHIEPDTLADLLHWFRKEASAIDLRVVAADPRLEARYQAFKADHLDRLHGANLFWIAAAALSAGMLALWTFWDVL